MDDRRLMPPAPETPHGAVSGGLPGSAPDCFPRDGGPAVWMLLVLSELVFTAARQHVHRLARQAGGRARRRARCSCVFPPWRPHLGRQKTAPEHRHRARLAANE